MGGLDHLRILIPSEGDLDQWEASVISGSSFDQWDQWGLEQGEGSISWELDLVKKYVK